MIATVMSKSSEAVSFLFEVPNTNYIGSMQCDATISTNYSFANDATSNPVEEGLPTSDFILSTPDRLTITGFIGNGNSTGAGAWLFADDGAERVQSGFDMLKGMIKNKNLITVQTDKAIYMDMAVLSVEVSEEFSNFGSLRFTIELMRIVKTTLSTAEIPKGISQKANGVAGSMAGKTQLNSNGGTQGSGLTGKDTNNTSVINGVLSYFTG